MHFREGLFLTPILSNTKFCIWNTRSSTLESLLRVKIDPDTLNCTWGILKPWLKTRLEYSWNNVVPRLSGGNSLLFYTSQGKYESNVTYLSQIIIILVELNT